MKIKLDSMVAYHAASAAKSLIAAVFLVALVTVPAFAQPATDGGYDATEEKVCGFLTNFRGLLTVASIAVVTIAVIFAGYQIAFAHKRIGDVAPILIGGLLIGAAGQIAAMIMPDNATDQCTATTSMLTTLSSAYFA